jgi:ribokinase
MDRPKICVVGSSNIDLISYVPHLPKLGETLHGNKFNRVFGGKGANQAVMAAKLGAEVSMVAKLGEDIFGRETLENFKSIGIRTEGVSFTSEAFSGVASIWVDPACENSIVIVSGANDMLTEADLKTCREQITSAQVLVCQLEVPPQTTLAALKMARSAGVMTVLNPAPARRQLSREFYEHSDIFCPNETETELLTGLPVKTDEDAVNAAEKLLEYGARTVILTLGKRGSLLADGYTTEFVETPEVTAVDTVGAGDAFIGSLVYFLAVGVEIKSAVARASHIAAVSVQSPGVQASFPERTDLPEELFLP